MIRTMPHLPIGGCAPTKDEKLTRQEQMQYLMSHGYSSKATVSRLRRLIALQAQLAEVSRGIGNNPEGALRRIEILRAEFEAA